MKLLCEAKPGDRVKIPLNALGGFDYKYNEAFGGCDVVVLKHNASWGTYIGWEEGKMPANMPLTHQTPISDVDRKAYGFSPKFKYGFRIDANVEIQAAAPIKKASSAGFLLACLGVGTGLSTLSQSMWGDSKEGMKRNETIGN